MLLLLVFIITIIIVIVADKTCYRSQLYHIFLLITVYVFYSQWPSPSSCIQQICEPEANIHSTQLQRLSGIYERNMQR